MRKLISVMLLGGSGLVFASGLWMDLSLYIGFGFISLVLSWLLVSLVVWRDEPKKGEYEEGV